MKTILHLLLLIMFHSAIGSDVRINWHIFNCDRGDVTNIDGSNTGKVHVLLDAANKYSNATGPCAAIQDKNYGKFGSYEIQAAMVNVRSSMGDNAGNLGIVFNYIDESNFDFLYVRYRQN